MARLSSLLGVGTALAVLVVASVTVFVSTAAGRMEPCPRTVPGPHSSPCSSLGSLAEVTVLAGLAPASAVGIRLVQTAYTSGSAASVLAGLIVLAPLTAVAVGGLVLAEAGSLSTGAALLLAASAAGALWGVTLLARLRPGTREAPASPERRACAARMEGARGEGVPAPS